MNETALILTQALQQSKSDIYTSSYTAKANSETMEVCVLLRG